MACRRGLCLEWKMAVEVGVNRGEDGWTLEGLGWTTLQKLKEAA